MKTLNIKKILVPIDFSETSMNALHTARSIARKNGAYIKLLFVHDNHDKYYPQVNLANGNGIIKALVTLSKVVTNNDNVACNFSYMMGDVSNCIIEVSNAENADLIIMGKNGNSRRKKKFAGSNTYTAIRKSICPVFVIPGGDVHACFNHILFPVRPTLSMLEKYSMIKEIAKTYNSRLHIINLRNPSYIDDLNIISQLVQLLKIKIKKENIQTSFSYYFADDRFADKILSVAHDSKIKFDLLVITSEDNTTENAFFISSYAQKIIHQANVPLLVIKPETVGQSKEVILSELEKQLS